VTETEDVVEVEDEGPQGPFSLADLDESAKQRALEKFWEGGIDWDCMLKPGYCDHEHYTSMLAERGIEVDEFNWCIGSYNGSDFVAVKGHVDVLKWLAWRVACIEAAQDCPYPRPRAYHRAKFIERPAVPPWVFMVETLTQSEMYWHDRVAITLHGRDNDRMELDTEWSTCPDTDPVCTHGVLAGATCSALHNEVDYVEVHERMREDIEEVCAMALADQQQDHEWHSSMECFEEMCEANEWRFDEDGNLV
jgi:hypothetical protein